MVRQLFVSCKIKVLLILLLIITIGISFAAWFSNSESGEVSRSDPIEESFIYINHRVQDQSFLDRSWMKLPLQGVNIAIDPGHGGFDPGYFTDEVRESDIVLDIALKLRRLIEQGGGKVIMTREQDEDRLGEDDNNTPGAELRQRVKYLSEHNVDILVSIHANSIPSPIWSGAQTFYPQGDEYSQLLAERLQENLRSVLANTDRTALPGDFFILRETPMASSLVEVGFLTNPREKELLQNEEYQEILAWALYLGILDYCHGEFY